MKKMLLGLSMAALYGGVAMGADLSSAPPPAPAPVSVGPWDYAFGGKIMSDYNFRGISQSARKPSGTVYGELRYNITPDVQLYAGTQVWAVKLPTDPSAEVDLFAGIRPTFGNLSLDFGVMRYQYPGERALISTGGLFPAGTILTKRNADFTEFYGKASYKFFDKLTLGASVNYTPDWLMTGVAGTYANLTAKFDLPESFYVSGEYGRYFFQGHTDPIYGGGKLPSYNYWNAGVGYAWKQFTLDARYHGTDASKTQCFSLTGDPTGYANGTGRSKWCGQAFIATLSVDITAKDLK